ncbi:hypothetical protein WAX78_14945 [Bacillus sp. FJAT-53711]|uniref:Uncharacterized protein n=2 Tax=Bacillus yunxiaonensis TaxID=3127665 RepID=A0ABU8FXL7_9BACI
MVIKQNEIKVVVRAGAFNNNPGWIQTQEDELNLLVETTWEDLLQRMDANDGVIFRSKRYDSRNQGDKLGFPSLIVDAIKR